MRTILKFFVLTCPILILAICVGCPQTVHKPDSDTTPPIPKSSSDFDKPEPHVEPLVPKVDPPEDMAPPEEATEEETTTPETTGTTAKIFGKYAVEAVPLPPIDDLTAQVDEYVTKIGSSLENLEGSATYKEDAADIVRDTNALSLVALAIGLAEVDSKYKKAAPQIIAAAKNLAAAERLEAGQKAYEGLKSALTSTDGGGLSLSWSVKIADLPPLMKAVPNLSSTVKRLTNTEKKLNTMLEQKPQQVYGVLAALAAISQGSIANVSETTKPDAIAEWKKYCEEFRDLAIKANAITHQFAEGKADYMAFKNSVEAISASCEHCHEVFCPSAIGKNE